MLSLLDSCTSYKDYINMAKEYGQDSIAITEHGNVYQWIGKKLYCDKIGVKYIHGVEIYLTEQLNPKIRDNYHTVLLARNIDGLKEINLLVGESTKEDHFYYKPRISFDEFLSISDNVISLSACLQSPLNKISEENPYFEKLLKKYNFLEVQPHSNSQEQKDFNKKLLNHSKELGIKLVATNDVHSSIKYKAECRKILQKSKGIHFKGDNTNQLEDKFDLTFKTGEQMFEEFVKQGVLSDKEIISAIENTCIVSDMCEEIVVDKSFKYPKISDNDEDLLKKIINENYSEKIKSGAIEGGKQYIDQIREEFRVFKKLNMLTFMLFMSQLITWCRRNGIPIGPSRGSVAGSLIAYLTNITEVDPIRWGTIFSRFANENRMEIGDIDIDAPTDSRDKVYKHIFEGYGLEKVAYVIAFGTVSDKGTIDEIGRALEYDLDYVSKIKKEYDTEPEKTKEKYKELFYYFDGIVNTTISQSIHPAGIVVSPITLPDNYGVIWKDNQPIIQIDMEDVHDSGLVKYDILALKNVDIIRDTCNMAGLSYPKVDNIDFEDKNVWQDLTCSRIALFEFEKPYAFELLKKYGAKTVSDISLINAALRPSGASYRDKLIRHEVNKNPSEKIDELLKDTLGWVVFQEQITAFLQECCGYSGSEADNCRRMIARKHPEEIMAELPKIIDGYCNNCEKEREEAEKEAEIFVKVIEDASAYAFGFNHSTGYSIIAYYCAYFRYYYPGQFITAYLNNANDTEDIQDGSELARIKNIKIEPTKFRHSVDKYSFDESSMSIFKGLSSIKYISSGCAKELYDIRMIDFKSFVDLLVYVFENTSVNSRQMRVLISINFFEEFGKVGKLLNIYTEFLSKYKKTYVEKTKEKRIEELLRFESNEKNIDLPISEQINLEKEYIGYISFTANIPKRYVYVSDVDIKYTPRAKLYCIATGKTIDVKIEKKFFNKKENKFSEGNILFCKTFSKKEDWRKTESGFEKTGTYSDYLKEYSMVSIENFNKIMGEYT